MSRKIKGYTDNETRRIEAFVAANRADTRTWQERVIANLTNDHEEADVLAVLAAQRLADRSLPVDVWDDAATPRTEFPVSFRWTRGVDTASGFYAVAL